jgi:hypothetical protein
VQPSMGPEGVPDYGGGISMAKVFFRGNYYWQGGTSVSVCAARCCVHYVTPLRAQRDKNLMMA